MKSIIKESIQKLDIVIWIITLLFFIFSAILSNGDIINSIYGAIAVIILMFFIGLSIELILSALKNVKGLGKITGFITNGPEALVLIVGLVTGDILFAASTPLGSNVMNPILLIIGIFVTGMFLKVKEFQHKFFFFSSFVLTAFLATIFFKIPESLFIYWVGITLFTSFYLFSKKFVDVHDSTEVEKSENKMYLPLGIIILLISGSFLDKIVSFTADASNAPKGLIGFLVLATLTSWPEFKSILGLLKRNKIMDSFMNIMVSNITNLWLASGGVIIWLIIEFKKIMN
ncbi:sodium:proton exchanger [Candidatus Gracilibacteria bacterium]|nr:MAG: sodium:proton exchanger [Candidatus Gracilibacteria bacterium]